MNQRVLRKHLYSLLDQGGGTDSRKGQGVGQNIQWEAPSCIQPKVFSALCPVSTLPALPEVEPTPLLFPQTLPSLFYIPSACQHHLIPQSLFYKAIFPLFPLYPHNTLMVQRVLFCRYFRICLFPLQSIDALADRRNDLCAFHALWYLSERIDSEFSFVAFNRIIKAEQFQTEENLHFYKLHLYGVYSIYLNKIILNYKYFCIYSSQIKVHLQREDLQPAQFIFKMVEQEEEIKSH